VLSVEFLVGARYRSLDRGRRLVYTWVSKNYAGWKSKI